jgi:serine/threonine protein kinase
VKPTDPPPPSDPLKSHIQTQYPRIGNEIQDAINTLRKLQEITGTIAPTDSPNIDPVAEARPDATVAGSASAEEADVDFVVDVNVDRAAPTLASGDTFGRYQIARLLGRGAMGGVYLAYDSQLQRYVALKTPSLGNDAKIVARFYREARAAAQLRSPYICPIHDVGQISGVHYLSMAFIEGQSLEVYIVEGRIKDQADIAKVTRKIARGLQKAHEHGIIHRDLKPENIMIDADGEPIVMDFGLARKVDDDIQLTTPGRLLGTPAYMSPEQVDGDPAKIGPATDIYSLGVILYRLLTGRLPFQGSFTSVLRQIASEEPPRPSAVSPELAGNSKMERLCLQMMAKAPADRPASMADVHGALEAFAGGDRIARQSAKGNRIWSWCKKAFSFWSRSDKSNRPAAAGEPAASSTASKAGIRASGGSEAHGAGVSDAPANAEDARPATPGAPAAGPATVDLPAMTVAGNVAAATATVDFPPDLQR